MIGFPGGCRSDKQRPEDKGTCVRIRSHGTEWVDVVSEVVNLFLTHRQSTAHSIGRKAMKLVGCWREELANN